MKIAALYASALLLSAAPAAAQIANPLAEADLADRPVMADAVSAMTSSGTDLVRLDAVLARLPRPTPLRAMVQTARAARLSHADRDGEAVTAIEEALRLLPHHPAPKLTAMHILTFTGSPQRAADLWIQASIAAPEMARTVDRHVMWALAGRLQDIGDRARADRLGARMNEIGFASGLAPERSASALARTRVDVLAGRTAEAEAGVTAIAAPGDMLSLYVNRRYEALWSRIAQWSGPVLALQSRRYLEELRGDWTVDDFDTAVPYARKLAHYRAFGAVANLFLPMFERVAPGAVPQGAEFLAPIVARSLAALGREAEARALLGRLKAALPSDNTGRELNVTAGLVLLDANAERWADVLPGAIAFLARADALGPAINSSATLTVRALQGCALWKTSRQSQAEPVMAGVLLDQAILPSAAWRVHLCRADSAAAREFLLARLDDERSRDWALAVVQPEGSAVVTPLDRTDRAFTDALRRDPAVIAAANRVGRVLPNAVDDVMPGGFDPYATRPTLTPPTPGTI